MAGYTDVPFRTLCIEEGADLTYSEMVSAEGLSRDGEKTLCLMDRAEGERQFAIQLFMGSTEPLGPAVRRLLPYEPTIIDINCGCPVPKVTKTGAGSSLMKDPRLVMQMVRTIRDITDIPVSVKFRTGWDERSENYLEFAQAAIDAGASMLAMHARTKKQGYAPFAHWEKIAALKAYCLGHGYRIPIVGSGDLFTPEDAKRMLEETGADGVMFARGAIGNPFIFSRTRQLLLGGEPEPVTVERRIQAIVRHLDLMIERYGEKSGCTQMRKHCGPYLKGLPRTGPVKQALVKANTRRDYICALEMLDGTC
jgi:nifR3 family TIM-barrel protein